MSDWNTQIIEEFRANGGLVGGNFAGANMILLHHVGRTSGTEYVNPVVYFTEPDTPGTLYVVASAAGAPTDPQWYRNLVHAGHTTVEVGTETFEVSVDELPQSERDRVYHDVVVPQMPGFADYETKAQGHRVIPVLALRRR